MRTASTSGNCLATQALPLRRSHTPHSCVSLPDCLWFVAQNHDSTAFRGQPWKRPQVAACTSTVCGFTYATFVLVHRA
jgi:hypothetical protein